MNEHGHPSNFQEEITSMLFQDGVLDQLIENAINTGLSVVPIDRQNFIDTAPSMDVPDEIFIIHAQSMRFPLGDSDYVGPGMLIFDPLKLDTETVVIEFDMESPLMLDDVPQRLAN